MSRRDAYKGWFSAEARLQAAKRHVRRKCAPLLLTAAVVIAAAACQPYGFKAGTAPAHLSTVYIPTADDQSGYGRGTLRQDFTELLIRKFRDDNTLRVVNSPEADSELEATIATVQTVRLNLSEESYETRSEVQIQVRAVWKDNVKGGNVYSRSFTGRAGFDIDRGAEGEAQAFNEALDQVTTEILNASVAMW